MQNTLETSVTVKTGRDAVFEARIEKVMTAVDLHDAHLRDYLFRLTGQWQDAEDLTQELWKYVLLHFPSEKIDCLPLLRVKAKQLFLDHYRAVRRRSEILTDEIPETAINGENETYYSEEGEAELKEKFWANFPGIELSPQQREAIWLHSRYGYSYEAIGQKLATPTSTIGDWIALGRKKISNFLNP